MTRTEFIYSMFGSVLNLPFGYLLFVSPSPRAHFAVIPVSTFALDVQSTSKLIDMIWLWYRSDIGYESHKRKFFEWNFFVFRHLYCINLMHRGKNRIEGEKCVRRQRMWWSWLSCFFLLLIGTIVEIVISYRNNRYSIFISYSITLFMWCMCVH